MRRNSKRISSSSFRREKSKGEGLHDKHHQDILQLAGLMIILKITSDDISNGL